MQWSSFQVILSADISTIRYQISRDIQMAINAYDMKRCTQKTILVIDISAMLLHKTLDHVQMTIATWFSQDIHVSKNQVGPFFSRKCHVELHLLVSCISLHHWRHGALHALLYHRTWRGHGRDDTRLGVWRQRCWCSGPEWPWYASCEECKNVSIKNAHKMHMYRVRLPLNLTGDGRKATATLYVLQFSSCSNKICRSWSGT